MTNVNVTYSKSMNRANYRSGKLNALQAWWTVSANAVGSVARRIGQVRDRRNLKALRDFDDRMLDDIGIRRDELEWAISLPLSLNAARVLKHKARERRLDERHRLATGGRR